HRGVRRVAEERGQAVNGHDGRSPNGELGRAEEPMRNLGASGQTAEQLATTHAYITGRRHDRTQPQAETGGCASAAGTAVAGQGAAGREQGDGDDLGLFGPDRPEPEDITAGEDASAAAWADGEAEWPPCDPWARRGLHNLVSRLAEEI